MFDGEAKEVCVRAPTGRFEGKRFDSWGANYPTQAKTGLEWGTEGSPLMN
jgi:hypothetical protein